MLTLMHYFSYLDRTFPCRWIGRGGPIQWPPHSPALTPCDFWLWGMVKERVYSRKFRNINELTNRIQIVVSSIPREMCFRTSNATVARYFIFFMLNMMASRLRLLCEHIVLMMYLL
jgi:hypothetical protein